MNAYLVLLWNRALAYPRAILHSGGPLSHEFLTVDHTLASARLAELYQPPPGMK